ncbi:asparagine synthetase [glutamine-hydrolyzing]-like isoform X2 [Antedon mediterranea]|uniref:asparagine synthetase [glutamine-hydrolyzing]-like isoform X2 n=1 Tax=Antedon mediterranea TaxID=105859 RepID=UPI003AF77567
MCGIWAIFGSEEDLQTHFEKACKISHRGPDSFCMQNINHFTNCLFGFHQLAIMDDALGMQPMRIKEFPHVIMMYNGEIYNYKKLRDHYGFNFTSDCDGEVLIHLYGRGGIDFMAKMLDGVFAFCILDTKTKKVYIGRDTIGVRPLFRLYKEKQRVLAICSEAKGLLGIEKVEEANGISQLLPGHYEEYNLGNDGKAVFVCQNQFHSITVVPKWALETSCQIPNADHAANIQFLFTEAVTKRFMANRRVGCFLSGGLDSSLVSALASKFAQENGVDYLFQTFAIGMSTESTDLSAARKVAAHIGSEHHEIVFTPEQGFEVIEDVIYALESYDVATIQSAIGMYLVSKYIKEKTDTVVVYSGEGADELCQGYGYFHFAPNSKEAEMESHRLLNTMYLFCGLRADRITAAHGLEIRVPFLDHHTPKGGIEKELLRKAFDGTDLLPEQVLWRKKEEFSDGVSSVEKTWKAILQEHIENLVTDKDMKDAPEVYKFNTPQSKEAFYYRKIFERLFPNRSSLIPYTWLRKWMN